MTCNKLFWIKESWQRVTFRTQDNLVAPIYFVKNNVTEENLVLSNWVWNAHQANPMFVHLHSILRLNGFQFSLGSMRDIFGLHMPWTKPISVNHSGGNSQHLGSCLGYEMYFAGTVSICWMFHYESSTFFSVIRGPHQLQLT